MTEENANRKRKGGKPCFPPLELSLFGSHFRLVIGYEAAGLAPP